MQERKFEIDLLKIVSVTMIIVSHIIGYGGLTDKLPIGTAKWYETYLLYSIFIPFLDCFAITTGYLMYGRDRKWIRLTRMHTKVYVYSVSLMIIAILFIKNYKISDIVYHILPTFSSRYWYWTAYVVVFVFGSFINKLIASLDEKECRQLLCAVIVIGVFYNVIKDGSEHAAGFRFGYSAIWLLSCYIIGALLQKIDFLNKCSTGHLFTIMIICTILTFAVTAGMNLVELRMDCVLPEWIKAILYKYNSITVVPVSVCLVEICRRISISNIHPNVANFIIALSNSSFGVYILHNHIMTRDKLMTTLVEVFGLTGMSPYIYIYMVVVVAIMVYLVCAAIDVVFEHSIMKFYLIQSLNNKIANILNKWLGE